MPIVTDIIHSTSFSSRHLAIRSQPFSDGICVPIRDLEQFMVMRLREHAIRCPGVAIVQH